MEGKKNGPEGKKKTVSRGWEKPGGILCEENQLSVGNNEKKVKMSNARERTNPGRRQSLKTILKILYKFAFFCYSSDTSALL